MNVLLADWADAPSNVRAFTTLRGGGASQGPFDDGQGGGGLNLALHVGDAAGAVLKNRQSLREHLPAEPAWLNQVHGIRVVDAGNMTGTPDADASIASQPGTVCAVMTADCLPVLLCDTQGKVIGAAHAGWRGLLHGVLPRTVEAMHGAGASEILAWLGPAIGPQSFEVGAEVRAAFVAQGPGAASAFVRVAGKEDKFLADIYALARLSLLTAGVRSVFGGGRCTVREPAAFYSYRRDPRTGRMASLIWME